LADSHATIIIIHGITEHKGRYFEFIETLNKNGFSVYALDLRGHGESGGRRGDIKNFQTFLNDIKSFISFVKSKTNNKIVLFGHSLGGLIALSQATFNTEIDLLIISSPAITKQPKYQFFYKIPYKLMGFYVKKKTSESKETMEYSLHDALALKKYTIRLLGVMIVEGVNYFNLRIKDITLPLLMIGGQLDNMIMVNELNDKIKEIRSLDKTLIMYEGVSHRVVQGLKKEETFLDIVEWLKKRI
jgi:lysophospholipase